MFAKSYKGLPSCNEREYQDALVELSTVAETLRSLIRSEIRSKIMALYGRGSSRLSPSFYDEVVNADKLMGGHGAQLSPWQVTNGLQSIECAHNQSVLSSNDFIIFHDYATERKVICKKELMAFLLYNLLYDNKFAVVNELSRLGSDPVYVTFILDLLKLRGKIVVVSAQMNYANDDLIEMESGCRIRLHS